MKKIYIKILFPIIFLALWGGADLTYAASPILHFSDLVDGPKNTGQENKGAFVTVWGKNFGAARGNSYVTIGGGQADNYPVWTDEKVSFQLGPDAQTGDIVLHTGEGDSNGLPFTVNSGHVHFVDVNAANNPGSGTFADPWKSPKSFYTQIVPGDILYFRSGTYSEEYGDWAHQANICTGKAGSEGLSIGWVAYPGETVTLTGVYDRNINLGVGTLKAHYNVFSQFFMDTQGSTKVGGVNTGGHYTGDEAGARNVRIVGNTFHNSLKSTTASSMSGTITITGDNTSVLGNQFYDIGREDSIWNNNHIIYLNCGSDDGEIAYNHIWDCVAGHVIQVHADDPGKFQYDNVRIHSNIIKSEDPRYLRGTTVSNVLPDTSVYIYNNILWNLGVAAIQTLRGHVYAYNNTIVVPTGTAFFLRWTNVLEPPYLVAYNNIVYANRYYSFELMGSFEDNVTTDSNLYFGYAGGGPSQDVHAVNADPLFLSLATGDFHLQAGSPAIDSGTNAVASLVTRDFDSRSRPMDGNSNGTAEFDIGAFEYDGQYIPPVGDAIPPAAPSGLSVS